MKLRIWSDVHNEFGQLKYTKRKDDQDTVLVIAGDFTVWGDPKQLEKDLPLLDELAERFRAVVYTPGNHEFYHGVLQDVVHQIDTYALNHKNLYFLYNDFCVIDGVRFIGATFWTDMNDCDTDIMLYARVAMNDYKKIRCIRDEREVAFYPLDAALENAKSRIAFKKFLDMDSETPTVIVTHHLPDVSRVNGYADQGLEYAYGNTKTENLRVYQNVKLWIHGHVHERQEYLLDGVRVVANPRGYYGYQDMAYTFKDDKIWEV
jgi:Icc-related predicted phosphoesterase